MAFTYYCTSCGHELSQDTVLFDMNPLLLGSTETNFNFLHLYFSTSELDDLISHGKPVGDGYYECELSYPKFLEILCGKNNYFSEEIKESFDLDEIQKWVLPEMTPVASYDDDDDDDDDDDEDDSPKVASITSVSMPRAVQLMTHSGNENVGAEELSDARVKADFQVLLDLFPKAGQGRKSFAFRIRKASEKAVDESEVLHGYRVETDRGQVIVDEARVCCHYTTRNNKRARCAHRVFPHAGTAVHKTIAFIGEQKSGKTSTIIAMADYAQKAAANPALRGSIWGKTGQISGVQNMELLDVDDRLRRDMFFFKNGVGPIKTPMLGAHAKPYNATFRVQGTRKGQESILTMTDLPGDLFDTEHGILLVNLLANNFPQAYSCQALVLCFDVSRDQEELTEMARNAVTCANLFLKEVCGKRYANKLQKIEARLTELQNQLAQTKGFFERRKLAQEISQIQDELEETKKRGIDYIPVMVTFNKCPDLEAPATVNMPAIEPQNKADRIRAMYFLEKEHRVIKAFELYRSVLKHLESVLDNAYHSALRIAPYGRFVPSLQDVLADPVKYPRSTVGLSTNTDDYTEDAAMKVIEDLDEPLDPPEPLQIRELMYWILHVAGCVDFYPKDKDGNLDEHFHPWYQPILADPHTRFTPRDYSVTRVQYRGDRPTPPVGLEDVSEAFARCHLFNNPTDLDAKYVKAYNNPKELKELRQSVKTFLGDLTDSILEGK